MSGLRKVKQRRKYAHFSEAEKRTIIEDYLQSNLTKKDIWKKYTGRSDEHGLLLYWMYKYGYISGADKKSVIFAAQPGKMNQPNLQQKSASEFEYLQMQRRIPELEKQLQESEMKSIAYQTMIEIAERELSVSIKKKFNTKPSVR
jgi:transposase-like protein